MCKTMATSGIMRFIFQLRLNFKLSCFIVKLLHFVGLRLAKLQRESSTDRNKVW